MADGSDYPGDGDPSSRWRLYALEGGTMLALFVVRSGLRATEKIVVKRCAASARRELQALGWSDERAGRAIIRAARI